MDTGAIEGLYKVDRGFTYTVAVESGAWEAAIIAKGEKFKVMFEAQLSAYEYILDWATSSKPISEALIRTLHQEICKEQNTYTVQTAVGAQEHDLPKGIYKTSPNHVLQENGSTHSYCPVVETAAEMGRYVNELCGEEFLKASAPQQAAYSHYAFVAIHPFADGNGRVARALASVFTYRELCAPLLVLLDNRDEYFVALAQADAGNYQPIVSFTYERVCDSIELIEESVRTAQEINLKDSISALNNVYYTASGFTHDQIDKAACEIAKKICDEVNDLVASYADKHWDVKASVSNAHHKDFDMVEGYRNLIAGSEKCLFVSIRANSQAPKKAEAVLHIRVFMPEIAGTEKHILFHLHTNRGTILSSKEIEISLESCIPKMAISTEWKLRMFSERKLAQVLDDLHSNFGEN